MAGSYTNYAELKFLEHTVGKTAYSMPTNYIAAFTSAPGEAGGGTEVSGGGYARVSTGGASWNSASGGSISNAVAFTWPQATADWGTIVAVAGFDASTGGNMIWYSTVTTSKQVLSGDTLQIPAGQLTISLD